MASTPHLVDLAYGDSRGETCRDALRPNSTQPPVHFLKLEKAMPREDKQHSGNGTDDADIATAERPTLTNDEEEFDILTGDDDCDDDAADEGEAESGDAFS